MAKKIMLKTEKEAAKFIGRTARTIRRWRDDGFLEKKPEGYNPEQLHRCLLIKSGRKTKRVIFSRQITMFDTFDKLESIVTTSLDDAIKTIKRVAEKLEEKQAELNQILDKNTRKIAKK